MKKILFGCSALALAAVSNPASAASLVLDYTVTPASGGVYNYNFTLRLANQDGSWAPGQQWDWIVFGDTPNGTPSPLADFSNFASSDPAAGFVTTGGGHNGPTVSYGGSVALPGWQPAAVGSTLSWSGRSFNNVGAGNLKFSTLVVGNGAVASNFQTANLVSGAVPEPATWAMMVLGFGAVGFAMRRRRDVVTRVSYAA